tara:strand:+ start:21 stop:464 length:444 start_codon:yes stop_codon:yes gene_type:complete
MKKILILVFITLVSCGPVEELNYTTPSGKPEILIKGTEIKNIKSQIINDYLPKGGTIEKESDFSLSILWENENLWGKVLLGTEAGGYKNYERITFNFANVDDGVKVFLLYYFVTGYGTSNEKADKMDSVSSLNEMMDYLKTLKYNLR